MTSESKENLLKLLINEQSEEPNTQEGQFYSLGYKNIDDLGSEVERVSYNGYTIMLLSNGQIVLIDSDNNILMKKYIVSNSIQYTTVAIDIDANGELYAIAYYNTTNYLFYLNNITQQTAEGVYEIVVQKRYSIQEALDSLSVGQDYFILRKSPLDSTFLITVSGINAVGFIKYKVNFDYENEYETRQTTVGTYSDTKIEDVYCTWREDLINVSVISLNSDNSYDSTTPAAISYYLTNFNFREGSNITTTKLLDESKYIGYRTVRRAKLLSHSKAYIPILHKTNTNIVTAYIYLNDTQIYSKVGTDTRSSSTGNFKIVIVNNQVFVGLALTIENPNSLNGSWSVQNYFLHVVDTDVEEHYLTQYDYWYSDNLLIQNNYNLYAIAMNSYTGLYVYADGYNGDEYFSDTVLTPRNITLLGAYSATQMYPVFSRNLFNKYAIGNTVNSISQIPYNYLNDKIVSKEQLISENESVIDLSEIEINKNMYEEVYLNNIDSFRVIDNLGIYNPASSKEIAKNLLGEYNYKILNYRVNYEDHYEDYSISNMTRVDNVATFEMYVVNNGIRNIEIYNEDFSIPFIKIDFSNYAQNKTYKLIQKVKVE